MSKGNSVGPAMELDTLPLRYVGDGAATSRSHISDRESVIGGVPSDWDIESTHKNEPDTEDEDKHRYNTMDVDWNEESDPEHNNYRMQTVKQELASEDKEIENHDVSERSEESYQENNFTERIDTGKRGVRSVSDSEKASVGIQSEDHREREYTPELPIADNLEESYYDSPDDTNSDTKVNENYTYEQTDENIQKHDKVVMIQTDKSRTHYIQLHKLNRVSPTYDNTKKRPKAQTQTMSKDEIQKKKNIIFGADDNTDGAGCCGWLLYFFSILLIVVTLPFSLVFCIKVVQEYERAVIFRLGRLPSGGAKGPGIFFIIPCIESYSKIDLRTVSFDVPPQEVLTKDSVTVSVDAVVYYRVSNPTISVANVENAHHSTRLLAQTTLRNILGTKNMSEILSDRESISQGMQSTLDEATDNWGIKVERVEIKDVRLPVQLQRAMAAEAEASREARAKVIAAEGEQKASHALKEAADVMAKSSAALQLRYLQTLSSISAEKNSTIIFPLPIDLLNAFIEKKS